LVEDFNVPQKDQWGDEPCAEVLRYLLEAGSMLSLQKPGEHKVLEDTAFIATANSYRQGADFISERLRTRCIVAVMPDLDADSRMSIFELIVLGRNSLFPAVAYEAKDALVRAYAAAIKLVAQLHDELMPCRCYFHWEFTMHNAARLCQALLALPPDEISSDRIFASFFCHECERELCDQLPEEQHATFHSKVEEMCKVHLQVDMKALRKSKPKYKNVVWTDIKPKIVRRETDETSPESSILISPDTDGKIGQLKPVESTLSLLASAKEIVRQHNNLCRETQSEKGIMDLILFPYLVRHLVRLVRVLKMERGSAVLMGAPQSGKKCVVRLAAFIAEVFLSFFCEKYWLYWVYLEGGMIFCMSSYML